jgi:hypothetical protein
MYFVLQAKVTRTSCEPVALNLLEKYAVNLELQAVLFRRHARTATEHNTTVLCSLYREL